MDELTGHDYATKPLTELRRHADFSLSVFNKVSMFMDLNTTQLKNLDIPGATNGN